MSPPITSADSQSTDSVLPRAAFAALVPPALAAVFLPIFQSVQDSGVRSVQGVDLTPLAQRDAGMMVWAFAIVLILFVTAICWSAPSRRHRIVAGIVAVIAALFSYFAVVVVLFAG